MTFEIVCMMIASFCFVFTGLDYIYYSLTDYWSKKRRQAAQNRMDNQPLKELRIRICMEVLFLVVVLMTSAQLALYN